MAFVRRATTKDAIWQRAWTGDAVADLASIAAIAYPNGPRHGDIAFITANSNYYLWLDNGSWAQITEIAETDGDNIFSSLDAIDLRRSGTVRIGLRNTGAGADLKQWYVRVSGVVFQLQTVDDTGSSPFVLLEFDRSGNATVLNNLTTNGNLIPVGGSVVFPATQVPSADVNALDDYEEGTWTPTDASGAGLSLTIVQGGVYTKIGRQVTVIAAITYPATASGANSSIGGLPFTILAGHTPSGSIGATNFTTPITMTGNQSTTTIAFLNGTTGANLTNIQLSGLTFFFQLTYFV